MRTRDDWELVTVLELLSPAANKRPGPDREQYLGKRAQLLQSSAHLVEIDLLRGGPRLPLLQAPESDYCILLSRAEYRPNVDLWPIALGDPLPTIPVPLKSPDPDASLNLKHALDQVYDAARYVNYIYRGQPTPRLTAAEAAWADSILRHHG